MIWSRLIGRCIIFSHEFIYITFGIYAFKGINYSISNRIYITIYRLLAMFSTLSRFDIPAFPLAPLLTSPSLSISLFLSFSFLREGDHRVTRANAPPQRARSYAIVHEQSSVSAHVRMFS